MTSPGGARDDGARGAGRRPVDDADGDDEGLGGGDDEGLGGGDDEGLGGGDEDAPGGGDDDAPGGGDEDAPGGGDDEGLGGGGAAELRAMRSVWLSMRDEDPPSAGLGELLAAARGKVAARPARPAWPRRLVAGLRRPAALAFATALVLVGGALVVGRHVGEDAEPAAVEASSTVTRSSAAPQPGRASAAGVGGPASAAGVGGATPSVEAAEDDELRNATAGAPGGGAPLEPQAAPPPRALGRVVEAGRTQPGLPPLAVALPPQESEPSRSRSPAADPARPQHRVTDDRVEAKRARGEAAPEPGAIGTAGAVASKLERSSPSAEPPAPPLGGTQRGPAGAAAPATAPVGGTLPTLYRQCEAAAARGDCVAVRRLVERIAMTDRGYRDRIAPRSPIAGCLDE